MQSIQKVYHPISFLALVHPHLGLNHVWGPAHHPLQTCKLTTYGKGTEALHAMFGHTHARSAQNSYLPCPPCILRALRVESLLSCSLSCVVETAQLARRAWLGQALSHGGNGCMGGLSLRRHKAKRYGSWTGGAPRRRAALISARSNVTNPSCGWAAARCSASAKSRPCSAQSNACAAAAGFSTVTRGRPAKARSAQTT